MKMQHEEICTWFRFANFNYPRLDKLTQVSIIFAKLNNNIQNSKNIKTKLLDQVFPK